MPYLKITVNKSLSAEQTADMLRLASERVARELGKPESYVMVELSPNAAMSFAGTTAPTAYVELKSIGLSASVLRGLSKTLCGLIEEHLGVDSARIYIEFTDIKGSSWGWNGSTF